MTSMTDPVLFIAISKEKFAEFQRQVYNYTASICVENSLSPPSPRHGLLSFVTTIETWQQLPSNAFLDNDVLNFRPRDVLTPPVQILLSTYYPDMVTVQARDTSSSSSTYFYMLNTPR